MGSAPAQPPEPDFRYHFAGLYIILPPDLLVLARSDAYLRLSHATLIGKYIFVLSKGRIYESRYRLIST